MVAPLVVAGAAAVARFIASKGMAAAIKKYVKSWHNKVLNTLKI